MPEENKWKMPQTDFGAIQTKMIRLIMAAPCKYASKAMDAGQDNMLSFGRKLVLQPLNSEGCLRKKTV
ncbi:hypothetical protein J2TS4_13810 [Paenibacillus sp. J2TS4]|nr:hypothetical protein J2TS4_13810 [Paenibacillus sp. J2TS4]